MINKAIFFFTIACSVVANGQDFGYFGSQIEQGKLKSYDANIIAIKPIKQDYEAELSRFGLQIPQGHTNEEKLKIQSLFLELQRICPDCSTGGTIGGGVMTGGNSGVECNPLFPTGRSGNTVIINRSEYESLKQKASFYDARNLK